MFEKRVKTIVYEPMLRPQFGAFLGKSIEKHEYGYDDNMTLIMKKMKMKRNAQTSAEVLGRDLAKHFFNKFVFRPMGGSSSNETIVSSLLKYLEFNKFSLSLPPESS